MATITVRNLDPELVERLKARAAANGRSMEAEVRELLAERLESPRARLLKVQEALRRYDVPIDLDESIREDRDR